MKKSLSKTKTRSQIANEYGITPRTLRRWLKKNKIYLPNRLVCPEDQKKIYEKIGYPIIEENSSKINFE